MSLETMTARRSELRELVEELEELQREFERHLPPELAADMNQASNVTPEVER